MAAEGLIDIVSDGAVVFKLVAGSRGYHAAPLAARIRTGRRPLTLEWLYTTALAEDFGCSEDLVVMSATEIHSEMFVPGAYRETFARLRFNPRVPDGNGEYYARVDL